MLKELLVFGDSWPAGAELNNRSKSFPYIMGQLMNVPIKNMGKEGSSVDYIVYRFFNFLKNQYDANKEYTALFCLTEPSRHLFWHSKTMEPVDLTIYTPEAQLYYKNYQSDKHDIFSLQKNIVVLESLCRNYNIKSYFVRNWGDEYEYWCPVKIKLYSKTLAGILGLEADRNTWPKDEPYPVFSYMVKMYGEKYIFPNVIHPNYDGHQRIAEELTEWITNDERKTPNGNT